MPINRTVMLGNIKLLEENTIDTKWAREILDSDEVGTKLFVVHQEQGVIGSILIADEIRPESREVVQKLQAL